VSSVSKHINILRKLKFKINRSNLEKLYISVPSEYEQLKDVSSANSLVREVNLSAMSFIYILNSKGLRTDPWGTPLKIVVKLKNASLIITLCSRL
jgi:hypothetical protein